MINQCKLWKINRMVCVCVYLSVCMTLGSRVTNWKDKKKKMWLMLYLRVVFFFILFILCHAFFHASLLFRMFAWVRSCVSVSVFTVCLCVWSVFFSLSHLDKCVCLQWWNNGMLRRNFFLLFPSLKRNSTNVNKMNHQEIK